MLFDQDIFLINSSFYFEKNHFEFQKEDFVAPVIKKLWVRQCGLILLMEVLTNDKLALVLVNLALLEKHLSS